MLFFTFRTYGDDTGPSRVAFSSLHIRSNPAHRPFLLVRKIVTSPWSWLRNERQIQFCTKSQTKPWHHGNLANKPINDDNDEERFTIGSGSISSPTDVAMPFFKMFCLSMHLHFTRLCALLLVQIQICSGWCHHHRVVQVKNEIKSFWTTRSRPPICLRLVTRQ